MNGRDGERLRLMKMDTILSAGRRTLIITVLVESTNWELAVTAGSFVFNTQ